VIPPLWRVSTVCLLAALASLTAGTSAPGLRHTTAKLRTLVLVPLAGLVVAAGIGLIEYQSQHVFSYYFWKFLDGVELISLVVLAMALTDAPRVRVAAIRPPARAFLLLAAGLVATQIYGYVGPLGAEVQAQNSRVYLNLNPRLAPIQALRRYSAGVADQPWNEAEHLVAAVAVQEAHPTQVVVYLAMQPADLIRADFMSRWYRSLTGTWTKRQDSYDYVPDFVVRGPVEAAIVVQHVLLPHLDTLIVLPPDMQQLLVPELHDPALGPRVVTW
jgi:hypothetical protein